MTRTVYPVIPPFIHVLLLEYTDCGLLKRFAFPEATQLKHHLNNQHAIVKVSTSGEMSDQPQWATKSTSDKLNDKGLRTD